LVAAATLFEIKRLVEGGTTCYLSPQGTRTSGGLATVVSALPNEEQAVEP